MSMDTDLSFELSEVGGGRASQYPLLGSSFEGVISW